MDFHEFTIRFPKLHLNLGSARRVTRWLLPTPGNVVFTLLIVSAFFWAQSAGAFGFAQSHTPNTSTGTIAYQGRLADSIGNPLTGTYPMVFRLYNAASGGAPLWEEQWTGSNSVAVSDGLFNVMLGSITPIPQTVVNGNNSLWLGISVSSDDEMTPRVQLGSVPYAFTVPDGSVTTEKIADEAVTQAKLGPDVSLLPPPGSITTTMLANNAVTSIFRVQASASQQTASLTWVDVPDLSMTISTSDSTLLVLFSAPDSGNDLPSGLNRYRILVDGTEQVSGLIGYTNYPGQMRIPISLTWSGNVNAGDHIIKVQWRVDFGTAIMGSAGLASLTTVEYKK